MKEKRKTITLYHKDYCTKHKNELSSYYRNYYELNRDKILENQSGFRKKKKQMNKPKSVYDLETSVYFLE